MAEKSLPQPIRDEVIAKATSSPSSEVRDLFERFLPEEQRTRRLGAVIDPAEILALGGNVEAGRKIFFEAEGVRCRNCHQIRDKGTALGPDLSEIGKQNTPAQLLEAMLEPSKKIDPKYLVYVVETEAGRIHTGLLVEKSADEIVLKDEKNELIRIPAGEVARLVAAAEISDARTVAPRHDRPRCCRLDGFSALAQIVAERTNSAPNDLFAFPSVASGTSGCESIGAKPQMAYGIRPR